MANALRDAPSGVQPAVLCASSESRSLLRQLSEAVLPNVPILSVFEVPDGVRVQAVGQVR
jgi:flagellar biosynthesis component FlhA